MTNRREILKSTVASAVLTALPIAQVRAQQIEQVKIFYGFPAGSAGDICARRVSEKFANTSFSKAAGIVENKPGAGGRIALESLKAAPTDGTALAMTPFSPLSLFPHIYSKLSYDPFKDFQPVGTAAMMHHGLAVGPIVPANVRTVRDFLAWAKANPKDAAYGSPAAGSTPHFIGALLGLNTNVDLRHVPYRGSVPGVTDVVGGQIAAMITPHGDFVPNHKTGKMRIIATSGKTRSPFVPEVATFAEQGFPELTVEEWFGFVAPARTPASVVAAANSAINAAIKEQSVLDSFNAVGLLALGGRPEDMARSQKIELDRWGPLIKRIGFTAES